jgi:hypothetical protein
MNTSKQFWALFRFQAVVHPHLFVLPIVFCAPLLFMLHRDTSLNLTMMTQNLFLVVLFGGLVIAPEIFAHASMNQPGGLGMEFFRTRAVDKAVLVRSKAAFFYIMILAAPIALILYLLPSPDLRVIIYSKAVRLECLRSVPGSSLVTGAGGHSNLVSIPSGNVLVAEWYAWKFLVLAAAVQVFVYWIYPSKYRRWFFFGLIIAVSVLPLIDALSQSDSVPWDERLFFLFSANQIVFWILALGAMVLGQLWCERRFAQLEL